MMNPNRYPLVQFISREEVTTNYLMDDEGDCRTQYRTMLRCNGHNYMVLSDSFDVKVCAMSNWKGNLFKWVEEDKWMNVINPVANSYDFKDMSSIYGVIECIENGRYDIYGHMKPYGKEKRKGL